MQKLPTPTIKILETELSADKFNKKKKNSSLSPINILKSQSIRTLIIN